MSAVEVEIGEERPNAEPPRDDPPPRDDEPRRKKATARDAVEVEIAREETKRQLIQSVSSIIVVVLYMIFTLLRDRESGVVVVDPDDGADDWDE